MNEVKNRIYHIARTQEDVLEIPTQPMMSQRAVYGIPEGFNDLFDGRPPNRSANSPEGNSPNLLQQSFSEVRTKVKEQLDHLENIARTVKAKAVGRTESATEHLANNPNIEMCLHAVYNAFEGFVTVMNNLNSKMDDVVNRMSRPKWEFKPGYQPYCQRSFDAGNYEYEVMIFRRRLNCMDKIAAKCNLPNIFR